MGTINYFPSDYITLGVKPYDYEAIKKDLLEEADEIVKDTGFSNIDDYVNYEITTLYEDDLANTKAILNHYFFYFYHVTIKTGYYEGFTVDIENDFGVCYDTWEDRRAAQKEITLIKAMLLELAGIGLVALYANWCTAYEDYDGTIRDINEAIKVMREEVKSIPTWNQLRKEA